jgi:hypothetical protein
MQATSPRVELIYLLPLGEWETFEAELSSMARRFIGSVHLIRTSGAKLKRFTSARLFLSKTVPNVIVLRGGEVVAHALGALPMTELKAMLESAVKCAA